MKVVYICHPYRNDPKGNKKKVTKIVDEIIKANLIISSLRYNSCVNGLNPVLALAEPDLTIVESVLGKDVVEPVTPLSVFHAFPPSMNESEKSSRELVMSYCTTLLVKCDECWVYSKEGLSEGMKEEIALCSKTNIPVIFKD